MADNPLTPDLILYGGAFDPPHQGHLDAVGLARARFPQARVLVLPAAQPAGAAGAHKNPDLPFTARLELAATAFAGMDGVEVLGLEGELPAPNYTLQTVEMIREHDPDARIGLLIGQDQFLSFTKWHLPRKILNLASLVVVRRDSPLGYGGTLKGAVKVLSEELREPFQWAEDGKEARFPGLLTAVYLIDRPICVAESRMIRTFLAQGQALPGGWMPPSVAQAISTSGYYGTATGEKNP